MKDLLTITLQKGIHYKHNRISRCIFLIKVKSPQAITCLFTIIRVATRP